MLNDAHLAAKREGERCVVVVDHTPLEEKRTAYAAELADAVELSVEIADYASKNYRSATPRRGLRFCYCDTRCESRHRDCGERSAPDFSYGYCEYYCKGWAKFHSQ